jgi:hypothetical protein
VHLRFFEEEDEQSGRRDAVENDGVDKVFDLAAVGKIWLAGGRGGPLLQPRGPWESSLRLSSHRRRS